MLGPFAEWKINILVFALGALLPLAVFAGQSVVRERRIAIIRHLYKGAEDLARENPEEGRFMRRTLWLAERRYLGDHEYEKERYDEPPGRFLAYLLPTAVFIAISAVGFQALLAAMDRVVFDLPNFALDGSRDPADGQYRHVTALVVAAAFLGAYIWSINYLILRVSNYDLHPLSFVRVSAHLVLSIFAAAILRHVSVVGNETLEGFGIALVLTAAFLMGFFPNLGVGVLADWAARRIRLKKVSPVANEIAQEYPVELIDGISASIKFRLASFDITDVQNLATANPVTIYMEAPFGHMEILDWISQAQLLQFVGPQAFLKLRGIAVRDIRVFLDLGGSEEGRAAIAPMVYGERIPSDEVIAGFIASVRDCVHVRRLIAWNRAVGTLMRKEPLTNPV